MNMESKGKNKKRDFSAGSLISATKNSIAGVIHFYKYERSAIVHLITAILFILASLSLNLTKVEWLFVIFILASILSVELINTAIEAVCDLVSPEYNPLIKIAKDCASAATGVLCVVLFIMFVIVYIPKIMHLLRLS